MKQMVIDTAADTPAARYTRTAIILHWVIAGLIAINVIVGLVAPDLPEDWIRPGIDLHKSIGLTVLGLVLMRILWRLTHPAPELPAVYPTLERRGAAVAHLLLYGLMLLLPLSGWMHDSAFKDAAAHPLRLFWLLPWFRIGAIADIDPQRKEILHDQLFALHVWAGYVLYVLVTLHILGALKHQFIDRHRELQRMWLR